MILKLLQSGMTLPPVTTEVLVMMLQGAQQNGRKSEQSPASL
jgi:hypothetical protein